MVSGPDAPSTFRLMSVNCNRLWSRSGRLCASFHGFARFLASRNCTVALAHETNTPAAPSLPDDQGFTYDGPENTAGRDAAFLVHHDARASCTHISNVTHPADICWRLFMAKLVPPQLSRPFMPHVGCPESERLVLATFVKQHRRRLASFTGC